MRFLILTVLFSVFFGCDKDKGEKWVLPPNTSLLVSFRDTTDMYAKYPINKLDSLLGVSDNDIVYYISGDEKEYVETFMIRVLEGSTNKPFYPYYALAIPGIAETSSIHDVKTWYIDWPLAGVDTLYADYYRDTKGPNDCMCSDPLKELLLNGESYIEDTGYTPNGVYVFE